MQSLISVIIPVYNAEKTIKDTLESAINQSYKNIEIIVINDGSNDDSLKIINEFVESNQNIKLINQANQGVSKARNIGIQIAVGEFIAFLDSDDVWDKDKLLIQIEFIKNNANIDLISCNINGNFYPKMQEINQISHKKLLFKNYFSTPSVLMKKDIYNKIDGFNEGKKYSEDLEYWLRISHKYNCFLINKSLVLCGNGKRVFGESGLSGNLFEMEKGELDNIIYVYKTLNSISFTTFILAFCYSILKFFRRIIIVFWAKFNDKRQNKILNENSKN